MLFDEALLRMKKALPQGKTNLCTDLTDRVIRGSSLLMPIQYTIFRHNLSIENDGFMK